MVVCSVNLIPPPLLPLQEDKLRHEVEYTYTSQMLKHWFLLLLKCFQSYFFLKINLFSSETQRGSPTGWVQVKVQGW